MSIGGVDVSQKRAPRGQKADLYKWVNDQQQLDMRTKFILRELAGYADADCCAWSKIVDLAYAANCTERTVQYHLRALEEARMIRPTGRDHRLENSTRSVPIYQLAPGVEGLDPAADGPGMGAKIAPMDGEVWVQDSEGMGATGLHPVYGKQGLQSGANAPSAGAREALRSSADRAGPDRAGFEQLVAAMPARVLKFSDMGRAFAAWCELAEQGVDVGQLADCARRMAVDPDFKSRRHPFPLEDWLGKGQWRGWWVEAGAAVAAVEPVACAVPPEVRDAFLAAADAGKVGSYLVPCGFEPGPPGRLLARTGMARDWLDRAIRGDARLKALGLIVDVQGRD